MNSSPIPFNKPSLSGKELLYVAESILRGHAAGDGSFTKRCHAYLEDLLGVAKALLTTSCTHAIEMSAILLDLIARLRSAKVEIARVSEIAPPLAPF